MKHCKKPLALLLAAIMLLGVVSCGKAETNDKTDKDTKTFHIVTVRLNDVWPTDFLNKGIMQQVADKYGVKIKWDIYTQNDWAEQKNLMFATPEDLPDAFLGSTCLTPSDMIAYTDQFVELTDYIAKDMPNLSKILAEDAELKTTMTSRDGKIYSLGKKLPFRPAAANVPFINKTWLDRLGLKVPNTYKELQAVLKAFKNQDADGDGDPNNEIPYSYCGSLLMDSRHILAPFGIVTSRAGNYMSLDNNGDPFYMPASDQYKQAVAWMHDLYQSGVIDKEHFTQTDTMFKSKLQAAGGSKIGYAFGWTSSVAGANADEFVPIPAVEGPDGNRYVESDPSYLDISDRELVVTKQCANVDLLLQWADEFYTDLVSLQTYYGSIPDQVTDNGDGTYSVIEATGDTSNDAVAWSNSLRDYGPKYMSEEFQKKVTLPTSSGDGQKLAEDVNSQYAKATFPMVKLTKEQYTDLGMISSDITSYVESKYAQWVVNGGVEKEWDGYIAQLKEMGMDKMVSYYLDAYDYYKSTSK